MFGVRKKHEIKALKAEIDALRETRDFLKTDREMARKKRDGYRAERNSLRCEVETLKARLLGTPADGSVCFTPDLILEAQRRLIARAAENHRSSERRERVIHLNYADPGYSVCQLMSTFSAIDNGGLTEVRIFGPQDLTADFREANRELLQSPRGAGFWAWKPHFILRIMAEIEEGDFVFYFDSGGGIVAPIQPMIDWMKETDTDLIVAGDEPNTNRMWCKADTIAAIGVSDDSILDEVQSQGGCVLLRKTKRTIALIEEWSRCTQQLHLIDDSPSHLPEDPVFREHRHDQAILSLLVRKHGFCRIGPADFYPAGCGRDGQRFAMSRQFSYLNKFSDISVRS